jgi:hypothetical protein
MPLSSVIQLRAKQRRRRASRRLFLWRHDVELYGSAYAGKNGCDVVGEILQDDGREWTMMIQLESEGRHRQTGRLERGPVTGHVSVMAEALRTPGVTLTESGGKHRPGPNISTRRAIVYRTSPNPNTEQPPSDSRKSKTVSFHSATTLPTERKISSGKLHVYIHSYSERITNRSLFAVALLCMVIEYLFGNTPYILYGSFRFGIYLFVA